jgi:hypothetical protein
VNSAPASPTPGRRAHSAAGDCPLLAQLPDISDQGWTEPRHSTRLLATAAAEYRVDIPNTDNRPVPSFDSDSQYEHPTPPMHQLSDGPSKHLPWPHVLQRTWRVDQASPAARRSSKVLPRSNPFAIPSSSLDDTLAPLARFAMMFVLFTIAGTTILVAGKANRSKPEITPPAAATTGPLLEPTTIIEPVPRAVERPVAASTAAGPLGDAVVPPRAGTDNLPAFPDVFTMPSETLLGGEEASGEQVTSDRPAQDSSPAASALEFLTSPLTSTGRALPQVQTSEPPKAVAHLPGHILESPSRQASNDDEPSVY